MTNNKQQTAVEFYLSQIFDIIGDDILDKLSIEQINKIHDLSIQAKAMHKEEMIDFGNDLLAQNDINYIGIPNLAEQYYNETFKGGEQ